MTISDEDLARLTANEPAPNAPADHDVLTDKALGETILRDHGRDIRYCDIWHKWLLWEGGRWKPDDLRRAEHLAKATLRRLLQDAAQINDDKQRNHRIKDIIAAERMSRIEGSLRAASSEPALAISPDQLDANPWLLNTANTTINLQTGETQTPKRYDLITKQAPCLHDPAAGAPAWNRFLERVIPDPDTRLFLQRACGYSMAGGNPAQILLILWGQGSNGKSTFLETIRKLLGDYSQQAPPETFLAKRDGIPNDIARLRGARFVAAVETGEGRRLNETLIKSMTGGDTMTARFLRQEYFEFKPQFTPWLATNHKPEIRGQDEAIWRRIRLIPFEQYIPPAERDPDLKTKLAAELPGILNWALDGCAAWQADGLAEPPAVIAATNAYREDQDDLGKFIADRCRLDPAREERTADLYTAYAEWAKTGGEQPLTATAFGRRLTDRGLQQTRTGGKRHWAGILLTNDQQEL